MTISKANLHPRAPRRTLILLLLPRPGMIDMATSQKLKRGRLKYLPEERSFGCARAIGRDKTRSTDGRTPSGRKRGVASWVTGNRSTASHKECGQLGLPGRLSFKSWHSTRRSLISLIQDLLQKKNLKSTQAEGVEYGNFKNYEQEVATQRTSFKHNVAYIEGNVREALLGAQEASTLAQTEIHKRRLSSSLLMLNTARRWRHKKTPSRKPLNKEIEAERKE
eukprot:452867-Amphidinium_carterae.2